MAFRIFSKLNTFYGLTGQLLAGGQLKFYEAGTTTPAAVYGDEELTVNNGVTVDLDSSGRPDVDVWGAAGASYFVELYDSDGVKQGEADDVQDPAGVASSVPSLSGASGKFLTNNGAVTLWASIREVPDPTGQANKVLSTDGTSLIWIAKPADGAPGPTPDIDVTATSVIVGDGTDRMRTLLGTSSAPASGGRTTSVAVTFASAFTTPPHVIITPTIAVVTGIGYSAVPSATNITASGFTANFDVNADKAGANINVPVTFQYQATGKVA